MSPEEPAVEPPIDQRQPVRWWALFALPALFVALVGAGTIALTGVVGGSDGVGGDHAVTVAPLELVTVPEPVAIHYRYAKAHESDLATIPCFCGCEEFLGHRHLYDCFVRADGAGYDSHAAGCAVCIGEAIVAAQLLDGGTPNAEVAQRIIEQFGSTPTTTPDRHVPRRT